MSLSRSAAAFSSASVPPYVVSKRFVSSRLIDARRSAHEDPRHIAQHFREPMRSFVEDQRAFFARELLETLAARCLSPAESLRKRSGPSAGPRPTALRSLRTRRNATTAMPSRRAAATRSKPGSLTSGVPASLTSAIESPRASLATSSALFCAFVVFVQRRQRRADSAALQQLAGMARILRRDHRHARQHLARAA